VIDYETFCKIRLSHRERGLTLAQIAHELGIHPQTVAKYLALGSYHPRRPPRRTSKLDPFKPTIQRWLERYPLQRDPNPPAPASRGGLSRRL
jgi:transposase